QAAAACKLSSRCRASVSGAHVSQNGAAGTRATWTGSPRGRESGSERVKRPTMRSSIAQLDVPVREIDKVLPQVVLRRSKGNLNKRPPFWSLGFADQAHVRFSRKSIALACIARDARANHVFPRG